MHENELPIDDALVRDLVHEQFPRLSTLPLRRFDSSGTVHAIYVLGNELAVRLPLLPEYEHEVLRDWKWLTYLSPRLPLAIPEPVALGRPSDRYPLHWLIVKWIDGENATRVTVRRLDVAAEMLGEFVASLRGIDPNGHHPQHYRGLPLRLRDALTRDAISAVADEYDTPVVIRAWEEAMRTRDWNHPPRLFHGDLHPGNLICTKGELSAVIDFGTLSAGDPSVDGMAGWWLFRGESREIFREAGEFDDEMWSRARGWALSIALIALPYYRESNPAFAGMAREAIDEVLADFGPM